MTMQRVCWAFVWLTILTPASAEVLKAKAVGCSKAEDAQKLGTLLSRDRAAAAAFSAPLVQSRSCMEFTKGLAIDIDQRRPPLVCIRLPGDLSCYWMATAFIDDHPSEKGSGGPRSGGGGRRHSDR